MIALRTAGRDGGFTILEMMVVMAIFALTASIVAARIQAPPDRLQLQAAASGIAARIRELRLAAIRQNRDQTLELEQNNRAYWTSLDPAKREIPTRMVLSVTGQGLEVTTLGSTLIRFHPDGSARDARIRLRLGASVAEIVVEWLTGAARIAWSP